MTVLSKINDQNNRLHSELAKVEAELADARAALESLSAKPGNDAKAAEVAARILVLEAQAAAKHKAIAANDAKAAEVEALTNSREYKDGQKKIAELEKFFQKQADDVSADLRLLGDRVQAALAKLASLQELAKQYRPDLESHERAAIASNNRDVLYLLKVASLLAIESRDRQHVEALNRMTADIIKTRPAAGIHEVKIADGPARGRVH